MRLTSGNGRGATDQSTGRPLTNSLPNGEERLPDSSEDASAFIYTTDLSGAFTSVNQASETLTGYTRAELLGSSIAQVLAPEHLALALEMTDPEAGHEHSEPYELAIVTKDGRQVPIEVHTQLIYTDGRPVGVRGVAREIMADRKVDAEIRRRVAYLEALNAIISTADAAPDLPRLLEVAIDRTLDVLGVEIGAIWAGDYHAVRNLPSELGVGIIESVTDTDTGIAASLMVEDWRSPRSGGPTVVVAWIRLGILASLIVPIVVDSRCIGVIAVASKRPRAWLPEEMSLVEAVAQQVGTTAEGLRLFHDVQVRAELMGRLVTLSESLNRPAPVAGVVAAIGQAALSLSGAQRAAVCLHQPDGTATHAWSQGVSPEYIERMVAPDIAGFWPRPTETAESVLMNLPGGRTVEVTGPTLIAGVKELPAAIQPLVEREGIGAIGVWPLTYEGRVIASVSCYYDVLDSPRAWSQPEREIIQTFTWQAAAALENAKLHEAERQKAKQLEQAYIEMVLALSRAMDARDAYTAGHSERLAAWANALAQSLGCGEQEVQDIRWGALLHDIGKIGVPDRILRKAGLLTAEERAAMRLHPVIGERILLPAARLAGVAKIVRHHQEQWDGEGYPDRIAGDAIPLGARILAVVDAYGAMTDERPYKATRTHGEAVAELRRCAGTQFDPEIVEAFCRVLDRERNEGDQVLLFT